MPEQKPTSDCDSAAANPEITAAGSGRVMSLDAIRGFDMFWIVGGAAIVRSALKSSEHPWAVAICEQLTHVEWEGFRFYDLIFPLFLFMIGAAIPFSLSKRLARGDSHGIIHLHILVRVAVLIVLGMMVNGKLLTYDVKQFQLTYSVLQMLALGYLVASLAFLHLNLRWQIVLAALLLIGYWALQTFVPVPGHGPGVYEPHALFGDWLNDRILGDWQGRWRFGWILGIMTHGATAMLGVFAGTLLKSERRPGSKLLILVVLGVVCLGAGWWWGQSFPIIKNRWTSTFALFAGGWSYLLLALFYLIIDIAGWRCWAFPFIVIGMNSIFAYMAWHLCQPAFRRVAETFLGGLEQYIGAWYEPVAAAGAFVTLWLLLCYMHRNKTYLRV